MSLRCLLPPSTGSARAQARGEMLQRALEKSLNEEVRVTVAANYADLEARMLRGEAELAWAPAAVLARLEARPDGGLRVAYKVLRSGRSTYRSAIVVHGRSSIQTVPDLRGVRAGWVDPLSLGGCLLALDHMRRRGVDESELGSVTYYGTHPAALAALAAEETDVGAVSVVSPRDADVEAALVLHAGEAAAASLRSIAITSPAPTDAMVLTEVLPLRRVDELVERLFLSRDSALRLGMETEGFEKADPGEYASLAEIVPQSLQGAASWTSYTPFPR